MMTCRRNTFPYMQSFKWGLFTQQEMKRYLAVLKSKNVGKKEITNDDEALCLAFAYYRREEKERNLDQREAMTLEKRVR
jgi:hypothetical protein